MRRPKRRWPIRAWRTGPRAATDTTLLRDEVETLQTMLTQREEELARLRVAADRWHEYQEQEAVAGLTRTARRKPRRYVNDDEPQAPRKVGLLRDVALVVAVAVAGVLFTPKIVAALPYEWQAELPAFLQPAQDDGGDATVTAPATAPARPPVPARPMALIIHGVNLRAGPTSDSKVIQTLNRGTTIEEIGQQGGWYHVRTLAKAGGAAAVSGWVYKTYLTPGTRLRRKRRRRRAERPIRAGLLALAAAGPRFMGICFEIGADEIRQALAARFGLRPYILRQRTAPHKALALQHRALAEPLLRRFERDGALRVRARRAP